AGHRRMRGIELPGMDGEHRRLAALAECPLGRRDAAFGKNPEGPSSPEGQTPAEDDSRQWRDLDERPALAADAMRPGKIRTQPQGRHRHHGSVAPKPG